jgi:transcriptional regulator with XRE-family HTH domain
VLNISTYFDNLAHVTGNDVKTRRKRLGFNQEYLARVLEVAVSTVARWEQFKDRQIPKSKMLEFALDGLEAKLLHQGYKKSAWKDVARKVLRNV